MGPQPHEHGHDTAGAPSMNPPDSGPHPLPPAPHGLPDLRGPWVLSPSGPSPLSSEPKRACITVFGFLRFLGTWTGHFPFVRRPCQLLLSGTLVQICDVSVAEWSCRAAFFLLVCESIFRTDHQERG